MTERSLLLVHGRDFKPTADDYVDISVAALRAGIERDCSKALDAFNAIEKTAAWYGDLSAEVLTAAGKHYDEDLDLGDRRNVLSTLREISVRKKFGIRQYDLLPGKTAVPEAAVDILAPLLGKVGLSVPLIRAVSKDFALYFDHKSNYGMRVRERLKEKLCALMDRDCKIVLMSHGTGSVVAYDVLWQLSHSPDLKKRYGDKKVDLWVTMGSPLGDSAIQKRLLGAKEKDSAKFPVSVIDWHNVSAEDDYACHDNTLADDFKQMLKQHLVSAVHDYKVFNLAVRYGKSNPHSSIGYFIHPRVTKILVDWLQATTDGDIDASPNYIL